MVEMRSTLGFLLGGRRTAPTAPATTTVAVRSSSFGLLLGIVGIVHLAHVILRDILVIHDGLRVVLADDASASSLHLRFDTYVGTDCRQLQTSFYFCAI